MTTARPRTRRPWPLQRRLIVAIVSIVALILIAIASATGLFLSRVLERQLDDDVRAAAASPEQWIGSGIVLGRDAGTILQNVQVQSGTSFLLVVQGPQGLTGAISERGRVVPLSETQLRGLSPTAAVSDTQTVRIPGAGAYRVAAAPAVGGAILVGYSLQSVTTTVSQMLVTIALVTTGGVLLLVAATIWIVHSGLRPLRVAAETARRVAGRQLDRGDVSITERVPAEEADPQTEIGQVGAALNTLLDHVESSLEARQRNEEGMRRFVADASHELRTPLASIRGYSELSLRRPDLADDTERSLERIQAQSVRMTAIVEDLLLLARLDEGAELVVGVVDLTTLVRDAVGDQAAAGTDHVWAFEGDDEDVVVAGDAGRLHQVVANLLANARIHTPGGTEVTARVTRRADASGSRALVQVIDSGPGIDPAVREELFERFSRADRSRARGTGGSGLGLSIARAIAHAHHGELTVESAPGRTVFTLDLPARPGPAAPGGPGAPGADAGSPGADAGADAGALAAPDAPAPARAQ